MKFLQQDEFILDTVSKVTEMKLSCCWWLLKAWKKIFNFHEQVVVWNNLEQGQNWA